jgi:hypothetical protein
MEAPVFWRETALQLPEPRFQREYIIPEEFVAKEDLYQGKKKSVDVVDKDEDTVFTSNLPPPPVEGDPSNESINEGPSPLIQIHQRPRRRTPPWSPLTTKPS